MGDTLREQVADLMRQHPDLAVHGRWLFGCCRQAVSDAVLRQRLQGLAQTHLIRRPAVRDAVLALLEAGQRG